MRILAIETSCDETAIAVVEASGGLNPPAGGPHFKVLKNIVSSQIEAHRPFGGVVPMLAKREHIKNLPAVFRQVQGKSKNEKAKIDDIDVIAVTVGPGLEPALLTGIDFAKELAKKYKKPLLGANHLEGHLFSFLLSEKTEKSKVQNKKLKFPAVGLVVSGGHTILILMESLDSWKRIGETRDDAVGEAFDKVARMLGMPYPGGPEIEKLAKNGNPHAIEFPRPMIHHKNYDFSFAGLKTAVYYYLRDKEPHFAKATRGRQGTPLRHPTSRKASRDTGFAGQAKNKKNVAASFQEAAVDVLVKKTMRAAQTFEAKSVILTGGVAANKELRDKLHNECKKLRKQFFVSDLKYSGDNAAMIAAAAYINTLKKKTYRVQMQANLNL